MAEPPRRPTIIDVAARAGVSKSLVSLAMRGDPRVAESSRLRIEEAARELGYRTNWAARSLSTLRSGTEMPKSSASSISASTSATRSTALAGMHA